MRAAVGSENTEPIPAMRTNTARQTPDLRTLKGKLAPRPNSSKVNQFTSQRANYDCIAAR
ncbi:hypothetical protein BN2475_700052 [Paraburkholderia ribeironis]|uniref:Uncharacterized protein n=2 Tax=Paraburkholderia ribeironis TaxID=1247936 RepID=A0A1N7SHN8_9BURK|nr:hypothetical protein BN2475_700052 [Paraburkholderia ribeironis]